MFLQGNFSQPKNGFDFSVKACTAEGDGGREESPKLTGDQLKKKKRNAVKKESRWRKKKEKMKR